MIFNKRAYLVLQKSATLEISLRIGYKVHMTHNGEQRSFYKYNFFTSFLENAREWCGGRFWPLRLLLLIYFLFVFVNHMRDPMYQSWFKPINLGIHELGHLIFRPFGEFVMILGGTFWQCIAPVVSFFMFYKQKDYFALAISFCWLSTNFYDVATYIADARAQALPLVTPFGIGAIIHDWNYMLSRLGLLESDTAIAAFVRLLAAVSMLAGLVWGSWTVATMIKSRQA